MAGFLTSGTFNMAYRYAELAVCSLSVAVTIATTPLQNTRRDGQAEFSLNTCKRHATVVPHRNWNHSSSAGK